MKYILLLSMCLGLLGCTTTWEMQKDELKEAYDRGEISFDAYHKQLEELNQEEGQYNSEQSK
jgi:hypothetical protein